MELTGNQEAHLDGRVKKLRFLLGVIRIDGVINEYTRGTNVAKKETRRGASSISGIDC